ncbi:LAGLIDADG family homing endonuclease [Candidatus Uhrbacteria bacterium]|nr:LAGLIDADG family homing endonuclease [Candidatus Uhrbacteria bacterium]
MELNPWYVSGFVDGEGSFLVSFSIRKKFLLGVETRPSFTISQHQRSKVVLDDLKDFFGCGTIRFNIHDGTYKYEVRNINDLCEKIIPHFEQYPLRSSKYHDFETWRSICANVLKRQHRTSDGLKIIITRAYQMNGLGARRYTMESLLRMTGR